MPKVHALRGLAALGALAAAVWLGGWIALGALVAPVVFRIVPAPISADAMTIIFRRFDRIAMGAAAVVLVAEALRTALGDRADHFDRLRVFCAAAAGGLAVLGATVLSPRIEALHRAGAIRGLGALGAELDAVHRWAEWNGKGQVVLCTVLVVLYARYAKRA